jgi:Protein of unknown function (DUF3617)
MGRIGAACLLVLTGALPAPAAELPSRKPGLWEIRMTIENRGVGQPIQQCIDASTDQMLQSNAGPFSAEVCPKRDIQRSDDKMTIDSTCTIEGKTATVRAVIIGSFDNAYSMTVTSQGAAVPAGAANMTIVAKWLGPCAKDQKPGDVIMPGGSKINIPEMRSRAPSAVEPGAPPQR